MNTNRILMLSAALSIASCTSAFAARTDLAQEPHRVVHKHHVAAYVHPKTASDADRDAGLYVVKPQAEPEYFGHASGSDGSMPGD